MRSMKHADHPPACTTGEAQLRFATREMLLTGSASLTMGKTERVRLPGGRRLSEGQGLEGLQGLARITPCTMG